jgi:hypothetical protein
MTTKLCGRAAFILAIGLMLGASQPSFAGPADAPVDNAAATAQGNPADAQAAPANPAAGTDQLSASDRAAGQDDIRQPQIVTQQADQPTARANPVVAGSQNATWDETSLIGKIFIGFGALLTIASAARMFMA